MIMITKANVKEDDDEEDDEEDDDDEGDDGQDALLNECEDKAGPH